MENEHIEAVAKDQVGVLFDENVYIVYAAAIKGTFSNQNTIVRARLQSSDRSRETLEDFRNFGR